MTKNLETKIAKLEEEFQKMKQQLDEMKEWEEYVEKIFDDVRDIALELNARIEWMEEKEGIIETADQRKRRKVREKRVRETEELQRFLNEK